MTLPRHGLLGVLIGVRPRSGARLEAAPEWAIALAAHHLGSLLANGLDITGLRRHLEIAAAAARVDPLTGLFNRRAWEATLRSEEARCQRTGQAAGVLVLDLDELKRVNDDLGHPAGDDLLRATASTILDALREADTCFRLGGDEFAAICPTATATVMQGLADRLQRALGRAGIAASIGHATRRPGGTIEAAAATADAAMYAVKRHKSGQPETG